MGQFRGGSFGFGYSVPQVMQIWLISFRPRFVLTAANQSLAGPRSDPATVHAPLFVPQRFNRIEICGAHCWEHPLITPTRARIVVAISKILGATIKVISAASACLASL